MNYNRIFLILVILLVALNTGLIYLHFFQTPHKHKHKHSNESNRSWLDHELQLTPEQEDEHISMRKDYFEKLGILNDSLRYIKARFVAQAAQFELSDSLSALWTDSINHWHRRADELTYQHVRNVRAILKPEQQTRWDSLVQVVMMKSRE